MAFFYYILFALGIAGVDQLTKILTVSSIPLCGEVPLVPGVVSLTYLQNDGAAFSSFRGMGWLFVGVFLLLTGAIFYEYFRRPVPFTRFERGCIAAIYGGGLGNLIDRIRLGYVVDMIQVEFVHFPIFNIADCFITCGCVALMLHLVICNKQFWKEEKK